MIFVKKDSNYVTYFSDEIGILIVDLKNINLDYVNFDEDNPEIIIHVRHLDWCNRSKQYKAFKKEISKILIL